MRYTTERIVKLAILSSLGLVLMFFVRFPVIPTASFLEYEPGDVPALVASFLYGPSSGLLVTAVIVIVQALTVSAGSSWIGALMHFAATGSMVLVAGVVYRRNPTFKGALMGLFLGSCTMIVLMVPLNFIFTSMFLDLPKEAVKEIIITAVIPFNVFKTAVNSTLTILLYKNVGRILIHWGA
ncbi:membrane protein [Thermovirga lienii DSM 17291]|uniref:Riboflavin transporter n=1 Tax=Thermovirga lienii (strain ATCC BAA-1197 / DSM 17291 / Cas60314) TaxID=580340 RepID=G7V5F3_THELD|nr:membrane protein [Thermovirga lienii DSM 17291]